MLVFFLCEKLIKQKTRRQFVLRHKDEQELKPLFGADATEKMKQKTTYKLICDGNFKYNQRVIQGQVAGELIVLKRPHADTAAHFFAPCHACHGYVLKADMVAPRPQLPVRHSNRTRDE